MRAACRVYQRSGGRGDADLRAELAGLRRAVNAVGNNANQLAAAANRGVPVPADDLARVAIAIKDIRAAINGALR